MSWLTETGIDAGTYRSLFRKHPGGVVVVTLDGGGGPVGFTATSLASVSLSPPLVSFAIDDSSSTWPHLETAETIVVHFLGHDQHDIATTFATSGINRFAEPLAWRTLDTGEPLIVDAPRWLRAAVRHRIPVGDHYLVIAEVLSAEIAPDADGRHGLVYHDGRYHGVGHP